MLEINFILRFLIPNESIISEKSKGREVERSNKSIVVGTLGHIISVSEDRSITRDEFKSGV